MDLQLAATAKKTAVKDFPFVLQHYKDWVKMVDEFLRPPPPPPPPQPRGVGRGKGPSKGLKRKDAPKSSKGGGRGSAKGKGPAADKNAIPPSSGGGGTAGDGGTAGRPSGAEPSRPAAAGGSGAGGGTDGHGGGPADPTRVAGSAGNDEGGNEEVGGGGHEEAEEDGGSRGSAAGREEEGEGDQDWREEDEDTPDDANYGDGAAGSEGESGDRSDGNVLVRRPVKKRRVGGGDAGSAPPARTSGRERKTPAGRGDYIAMPPAGVLNKGPLLPQGGAHPSLPGKARPPRSQERSAKPRRVERRLTKFKPARTAGVRPYPDVVPPIHPNRLVVAGVLRASLKGKVPSFACLLPDEHQSRDVIQLDDWRRAAEQAGEYFTRMSMHIIGIYDAQKADLPPSNLATMCINSSRDRCATELRSTGWLILPDAVTQGMARRSSLTLPSVHHILRKYGDMFPGESVVGERSLDHERGDVHPVWAPIHNVDNGHKDLNELRDGQGRMSVRTEAVASSADSAEIRLFMSKMHVDVCLAALSEHIVA